MTFRTAFLSTFACIAMLLLSATAHAGLFRAYISSTGNDANACTLQAPCRLLPAALAAVNDGGEIWMLDSANYNTGPVNIAKSVNIRAIPGVVGSVLAINDAIVIATAGVKVALRNLVITPLPGATAYQGINMTQGAALTVEDCLIANMSGFGIIVTTAASVRITDTTIRDSSNGLRVQDGASATIKRATFSGNTSNAGVIVIGLAPGTTTSADISESTMDTNYYGVWADSENATAAVRVSVHDSQIVRNTDSGVVVTSSAGASVNLTASNNIIANNKIRGIWSGTGGSVWASGNTISGNDGVGILNYNNFTSAGNNAVFNNGTDISAGNPIVTISTK